MLVANRVNSALIAAVLAGLAGHGGTAHAREQPDTIHEAMVGQGSPQSHVHQHAPQVARYVSDTGSIFILDRSGPAALFRLEHSVEIWALRPTPGPGGDIIYKNDLDQPVVRVSRLGGLTLFTTQRPMGVPASLEGEGAPYRAPTLSPQILFQVLLRDSSRASRAAQRLIPYNAESRPGAEFLLADAAGVVTEALVQMSSFREGRVVLERVKRVRLTVGKRAEARFHGGEIDIVVMPKQGLAGRPSSGRIAKAVVESPD